MPRRSASKLPWIAVAVAATLAIVLAILWTRGQSAERLLQPLIQFQVDLGLDSSTLGQAPVFSPDRFCVRFSDEKGP